MARTWLLSRLLFPRRLSGHSGRCLLAALLAAWGCGTCSSGALTADALTLALNGSFEELAKDDAQRPARWYFLHQARLVDDGRAPDGKWYVRFTNAVPGRAAQAQQHFALD